jgi:xanthine dehydrogenase molybdopterin-binding subunit B
LLAWKTQRPVRLHLTRPQSVDLGVKRHPMQIDMQTGCDAQGRLTYHQVQIVADTGAYATHGPEVLDAALEHAPAPTGIRHWTSVPGWPIRTTASPVRFAASVPQVQFALRAADGQAGCNGRHDG